MPKRSAIEQPDLEAVAKRLSDEMRALPIGPARGSPEAEWLKLAWRVIKVAQGEERAQRGSSRAEALRLATQIANGDRVPVELLINVVLSPSEREFRKKLAAEHGHAVKKTNAQLDAEIAEALSTKPQHIRYLKITQTDGVRYILRVTRETPDIVVGIEVDAEGDEIVPRGIHPKAGAPYHQRERRVMCGAIKKAVEMRMNPHYATLEVVPRA